jgi:hypothetical protein
VIALAATLHAAFDAVAWRFEWAIPPYLRLADAPEPFQALSPVAVSIATSCVGGVIAAIAVAVVEPARRRRAAAVSAVVAAFWMGSALLTRLVWFSTPWWPSVTGLLCGIPRALVIGAVLAHVADAPANAPPKVDAGQVGN